MEARLNNEQHKRATHDRWRQHIQHTEWRYEQCGRCTFWLPLTGDWGLDWGVCSNPESAHDRSAMFEHDGCAAFEDADEWVLPDG